MTFCSMTLACVYSRISWTSKAKDFKTAALTIQMAWKMFGFIVCIFLYCSCESNFRWEETDFRSRQHEAPVPTLQHERRRLRSCSDAVFSVNELQKKDSPNEMSIKPMTLLMVMAFLAHRIQGRRPRIRHLLHAQQWSICWWKKSSYFKI